MPNQRDIAKVFLQIIFTLYISHKIKKKNYLKIKINLSFSFRSSSTACKGFLKQ